MYLEINNIIEQSTFNKFKKFIILLNVIFSFIQLTITPNYSEIILILILINLGSGIACQISLNRNNLTYFLIPSLMILTTNFFYLVLPLFFTTIVGQAINTNLEVANKSFVVSFIYLLTVIVAMKLVMMLSDNENNRSNNNNIFFKLNVFNLPNYKATLVIFYIILLLKFYLAIFDAGLNNSTDLGDKGMKFLYGLQKFFNLPIIMFFYFYFLRNQISKKKITTFIIINLILSVLFATLTSSRTLIFEMLFIIIFCYFLLFLTKKIYLNGQKILYIVILIISFATVIEILSNKILASRMHMKDVSSFDLLKMSAESNGLDQKITLDNFHASEYEYTDNLLINRFTPIKYLDKMLYDASFLSNEDIIEFRSFILFKFLSVLPQNFTNIIFPDYNKINFMVGNGSMMERLAYNKFGGDFNKGSFIGEIYLLSGSYFLCFLIIFFLYLFLFTIISKFQYNDGNKIHFSPLILMMIFNLLYASQADTTVSFFILIIRMPLETILLYNLLRFFIFRNQIST